ncbi:MoxR family ATPase [Treponema sp.]
MQGLRIAELAESLENEVGSIFVGSKETVHLALLGLLGGMHVLIEDIPGVGKTTLALALARAAGLSFSRIQFTPDMLPGDVLGVNVWDPMLREFVFQEGPINAQCILADELNRTSPRTQSAFLEAMQEGRITIDGRTRVLPAPFFLIGTQNPSTFAGTFPLPEAELDRFGLSFSVGYPTGDEEVEILRRRSAPGENAGLEALHAVADPEMIAASRREIAGIHVAENVRDYIVAMIRATRQNQYIRLGASPRASIFLQHAARSRAAMEGRDFVLPEDVQAIAPAVLSHRIILSSQARLEKMESSNCIRTIAASILKPTGL